MTVKRRPDARADTAHMTDLSSRATTAPTPPDHGRAMTDRVAATTALPTVDGSGGVAADARGPWFRWHRFEHWLGTFLEERRNRIVFGLISGAAALLLKIALNHVTGEETGFIAYYLLVAMSAATGGMASG